jgi:hypothetical protein
MADSSGALTYLSMLTDDEPETTPQKRTSPTAPTLSKRDLRAKTTMVGGVAVLPPVPPNSRLSLHPIGTVGPSELRGPIGRESMPPKPQNTFQHQADPSHMGRPRTAVISPRPTNGPRAPDDVSLLILQVCNSVSLPYML